MSVINKIFTKKIILYLIVVVILLIGIFLFFKKSNFFPSTKTPDVTSSVTNQTSEANITPTTNNSEQKTEQIIDTSLFDNKKFQSLKENFVNLGGNLEVGKRNPFAPGQSK